MNQGKVGLREIGSQKLELDFSEVDGWVQEALQTSAPHEDLTGLTAEDWAKNSKCKGHIRLERLEPDYQIEGNFEARVPVLCPLCGASGSVGRSDSFRLFIHPVGNRETYEEGDDPDYIFLETPWVDLRLILSEQIVAAESVVEYPDEDLKGAPHKCEPSANKTDQDAGQIDAKARSSPFAVLNQLKKRK